MPMEIWTAKEKKGEGKDELIIFEVQDKNTRKVLRTDGILMQVLPLPWSFTRSENGNIYLDGKSTGNPDYHPIEDSSIE